MRAQMLNIQVFRNVTPTDVSKNCKRFHFRGHTNLGPRGNKIKSQTFKTSGTGYKMIQPHIPEDLNIVVYANDVKVREKSNGDDSQSIPL